MKNSLFDLSKNYSYIVDASYIIFCSAASAFKDYVYQSDILKSDLNKDFDPTIDPEFNDLFYKKFCRMVIGPVKQRVPFTYSKSNYIFTLDCPRNNIWRRDVYPEYKLTRDAASHEKDQFNIKKVFQYAYNVIIPSFCDETGSIVIKSDYAESDDIIAVLCKKLQQESDDNYIIILSSDRDMVQLHSDRVMIVTAQNDLREPKKEIEKMINTKGIKEDITAEDFLLFKIIIGDGSDNIPGIKKRFGPKSAYKLIQDKSKESLKSLLKEDINILNSFKRNKKIISFKEIPAYIEEEILRNIDEAFANKPEEAKTVISEASSGSDLIKDLI